MNNRPFLAAFVGVFVLLVAAGSVTSQCPVPALTSGLQSPGKIIFSTKGSLLVTESGTGVNTGRISIIDPNNGTRRTLITGLPAGFSPPNNDLAGPSGLAMHGRTLYVEISLGDAVIAGPLPNSVIPNPNPSSPIFSSVLAIHFSASVEMKTNGFTLSAADQVALKTGATVDLSNGGGDKITVELVADFPDYLPEPRPGLPNAVRQSNPFGLALDGDHLYVAEASGNTVRSVDLQTGNFSVLTNFAPLPNNRGFGPPVVEAVPDSIHLVGNQLLVTLLSGFPFPLGNAQVRAVDPVTGNSTPFITGLTSAIDVLPDGGGGFFTLEYSADMLAGLPGRLSHLSSPTSAPTVLSSCLITPTSMALDDRKGEMYITQIGTGQIVRLGGLIH